MKARKAGKFENIFQQFIFHKPSMKLEISTLSIDEALDPELVDSGPKGNDVDLMVSMHGSEPV